MKPIPALTLAAAALLGSLALPGASAQAAPAGAAIGVLDASKPVVEEVQYRRRVVRRRSNDAALAAGVIGAAVVGGALIAESQRRQRYEERAYYYGNGYYDPGYQPAQYYGRGYYQPPEYNGRIASDRYGNTVYLPTPQPGYGGRGYYRDYDAYPRSYYRNRTVRDPAGGGHMSVGP